jgi:tetratricopeptide (TPR) repeat protein
VVIVEGLDTSRSLFAVALFAITIGALSSAPASAQDARVAPAQDARVAAASPEAVADPTDPASDPTRAAAAQSLFRRGVELGEAERWSEALEHFRRSREIAERPNTVFNIAYALVHLGRFGQAIRAFDEYLAITRGEVSERRNEAIRLRAQARTHLAQIEIEVSPADAQLFVDGEAVAEQSGSLRTIELDPGRHVVRAAAPAHDDGLVMVSVLPGERGHRQIALVPEASFAASASVDEHDGRDLIEEPLFWVIAGVAVVGAGVGIGVGVAAATASGTGSGGSTGVVLEALSF